MGFTFRLPSSLRCLPASATNLNTPEHVAVVGDGQGGLPSAAAFLYRFGMAAAPSSRLNCVDVEVRERGHRERGTGRSWKAFKGTRQGQEKGHQLSTGSNDRRWITASLPCHRRPPTASTPPCNNTTGVPRTPATIRRPASTTRCRSGTWMRTGCGPWQLLLSRGTDLQLAYEVEREGEEGAVVRWEAWLHLHPHRPAGGE